MDERVWTDRPLAPGETIAADGVTITLAPPRHAALISGDLAAALAALAPGAPLLGFGEDAGGGDHAIRMARDRALLVTAAPLAAAPGWHASGYALSPADDTMVALTLNGPAARAVLSQVMALDPDANSPSAALHIAGTTGLFLREGSAFVIWIDQAYQTYLAGRLRQAVQTL